MTPGPNDSEPRLRTVDALTERVKELRCLYDIAEVLQTNRLSLQQTFQRVVDRIPTGWTYPDLCQARLGCLGVVCETPKYRATSLVQRVPIVLEGEQVGSLEVSYPEGGFPAGDDPFLIEEKKLLEVIAQKVGEYAGARQAWIEGGAADGAAPPEPVSKQGPEWRSILLLVRQTDTGLHGRLLRRLMNYLVLQSLPLIQSLAVQFNAAIYAQRKSEAAGENEPLPKGDMALLDKLVDEVIRLAGVTVQDDLLTVLLKQWIRQDRLGLFALDLERRSISLAEVSGIVSRFCRETREGDPVLSRSDELGARVALTRRLLTDSLPLIRVAREHLGLHDFGTLLQRVAGPAQGVGRVGGKAAGLILAWHILKRKAAEHPLLASIKIPHTWYLTTDSQDDFLHNNALEDLQTLKFASLDEVRNTYPYLEQVFKHSHFTPEIVQLMRVALEDLGEGPLIVRSSSLLEDNEGTAFSGKYRSLFLTNQGPLESRLEALLDAIAEVYASTFGPDPIQYRTERGLLDFNEEMGIIIQRVIGQKVGKYFFPAFAGVMLSNNEFRWSPRIKREDGIIRMVVGLGTRAVDRIGSDFPTLVCPGRPDIRVNVTPDQIVRYSQKALDLLNLETGGFESVPIEQLLRECGDELPMLERLVSIQERNILRKPMKGMLDLNAHDVVVTFAGLLENTDFIKQMREVSVVLQQALGVPVDVEFAHDGKDLYLLQCRPQCRMGDVEKVSIPHGIPSKHKVFSANKYVTNGRVTGIRYVVYVDPAGYSGITSRDELVAVADAVSKLNGILPRRKFILMGPGRWGSRGDITLGVGVTYAGICNTQMLIEIARRKGGYVPDLSFGTHFFQDLVEANIRYLALYPDEEGDLFDERFFLESPNAFLELLPEYVRLERVIRVIDVQRVLPGGELNVYMDGENDQALAFLTEGRPATA